MRNKFLATDIELRVELAKPYYQGGIVLATGCFDILHRGHVELLMYASGKAPYLWVGINSDGAVRCLKGSARPINTAEDRAFMLAQLFYVDTVFIIDSIRVDQAIRYLKPAAWVKGGGYTMDTLDKDEVAAANEVGADIVIVPTIGNYSTTKMLQH